MPDPARGLTPLGEAIAELARAAGAGVRVWRADNGGAPVAVTGADPGWAPALDPAAGDGERATPAGPAWFAAVPDSGGHWVEIRGGRDRAALAAAAGALVRAHRDLARMAGELSERYEEIDLIYTISEILGHTIRLDEAAARILGEVSDVVGARRATLFAADPASGVLRLVAARGMDPAQVEPIEIDDVCSVAARVFREAKTLSFDPTDPRAANPGCGDENRGYRGRAFLSVPVVYATPGGRPRTVGVINLTDRSGPDAFSAGDRKLVAAIANQIGAALENQRLVAQERAQQRVRRELELAHDLQLKLLPSPLVIAARADVAARCRPAESVGGDFYNLLRLHGDRLGVMIGDVSTHGFGAALIMALAMAASGIHAESSEAPSVVLARLEESLRDELTRTEMFLTLFYAVVDPAAGRITYANAGHPHAFLVTAGGEPLRLAATRPPLGFDTAPGTDAERAWRRKGDVLALFTDGIADARNRRGERFGEARLLGHVRRMLDRPVREMQDAIFTELEAWGDGAPAADDRTLVLLRA